MAMAKRAFLFILTNLAIMLTLSIILRVTGLDTYFFARGGSYEALAAFCLFWGMGGSFLSLMISKWMAKRAYSIKIIDPNTANSSEQELVQIVYNLARGAGISKMPEVGIYNSPEVNAFATGPSKNNSLVAVSSGLLQRMYRQELEGVLGHEVAHIANGDMVTMTLLQGVVNAFVMFFARVIAQLMSKNEDGHTSYGMIFMLEVVFGFFGMMVVAAFSRYREFRADHGGATLAGRPKMIAALEALKNNTGLVDSEPRLAAFKISGKRGGMMALFSTHPPLEDRIMRLKMMTN